MDLFEQSGASFSPCGTYRYTLWRRWSFVPPATFVLLNPSTADATRNDPTVERCERRARELGCGGIRVANLFALRSTDPARYRASWELSRARLAPSVRIRRGRPIDARALLDEMIADENGCEDRSLASLELWLHAALPVVDPRWSHERRERATCAVSDALGAREAK